MSALNLNVSNRAAVEILTRAAAEVHYEGNPGASKVLGSLYNASLYVLVGKVSKPGVSALFANPNPYRASGLWENN
jgi:hypothetical protein